MSRSAKLTLTFTLLALVIGIVAIIKVTSRPAGRTITISTQPSTRKSYPHAASASLGRLHLMRQATLEAEVPDDFRRRIHAIIDDTHQQLTAALDDDTVSPTTRDARIEKVQDSFARAANDENDRPYALAMRDQLGVIWFELDLLSRRRLLPLMFQHLDMTPEQRKQADAAFMEVSVVLRNEPAGGAPNERSMQAMLSGRDKLHALLTPAQRDKLAQVLHEQQQARRPRLSSTTRSTNAQNLSQLGRAIIVQTTQPTTR